MRRRVLDAFERLAADPAGASAAHLVGTDPPEYRLRVGDWRVRFLRDDAARTITMTHVLPRGRAYR